MLFRIIAAYFGGKDRQYNLALLFENKSNFEKAFYWYQKAAFAGSAEAQCNLGAMYYKGLWVEKDYRKAFKWFACSACQDQHKAYFNLGLMYMQGQGVPRNKTQAIYSLKRSAHLGNKNAEALIKQITTNNKVNCGYLKAVD